MQFILHTTVSLYIDAYLSYELFNKILLITQNEKDRIKPPDYYFWI